MAGLVRLASGFGRPLNEYFDAIRAQSEILFFSKVIGPGGELVVSALGQQDDQGTLSEGLGTYRLSFVSIERFE